MPKEILLSCFYVNRNETFLPTIVVTFWQKPKNKDVRALISYPNDKDFISIMFISKYQLTNPYYIESFIRNKIFVSDCPLRDISTPSGPPLWDAVSP